LASVTAQAITNLTIFIVDGSDDDASFAVVQEVSSHAPASFAVKYMKTAAGLARQRNVAIQNLEPATEYVCFLDDDAVIAPDYVVATERAFCLDDFAEVVGVGGLIQNPPARPYRFLRRLFFLDSRRGGTVLASGVNVQSVKADRPRCVDWIAGCAMSFRRSVFGNFWFDSSLQGYSLGEDVDFTYRLSRRHKLLVAPDARIWHVRAEPARDHELSYAREQITFRYRLVRSHPGELSVVAFAWSCVGEVLQNLTYLSPARVSRQYRRVAGIILGLWDITKSAR
jgi:GT2 family glycosyltransferase